MQTYEETMIAAEGIGEEHGKNAASWVEIPDFESASRLLSGINDGNPEIMDTLPSPDLSGQWADGYTTSQLMSDVGDTRVAESDICDAYELGFSLAVETTVALRCAAILNT